MTLTPQRCVFAAALTVWGMMLTYFCLSGRVAAYLHPSFHPWALAAGIILLVMAAGVLFLPDDGESEACCDGACCDEHGRRSHFSLFATAFILIVPPVIASTFSPSQFGATAVINRGIVEDLSGLPAYQPFVEPALPGESPVQSAQPSAQSPTDYMPRNEAGQIKAEPVDLLYALEEPGMRADFENKEVEIIGQFMPARGNNPSGKRFSLVKMFIMCCAADARPVAVAIETPSGLSLPEMSWVKVTGRATFPVEGGKRLPVVLSSSVEPTDPPAESFIYN